MEFRLAGYFPKRVLARPAFLDAAAAVVDICSVSHCISAPPDGWLDHWLHNALGFFDSPDIAAQVVPPSDTGSAFEHSPLSCNGIAPEYPVNAHCLLDDLDTAVAAAERFSIEKPEPGMYYVAEVLAPERRSRR